MPIFGIILREPNPIVKNRIAKYSEYYELSPTFFVVSHKDVADGVSARVGITGDDQIAGASGAVFQLHSGYAGRTLKTLWDWLDQHESDF